MYLIKNIMFRNENTKNKHLLKDEQIKEFYDNVKKELEDINNDVIIKNIINKKLNYFLFQLKNNTQKTEYREFYNNLYIVYNNDILFSASKVKIKILLMEYINGNLIITANYQMPFDESRMKIYATYKGNKFYATKNNMYSDYKVFGQTIYSNYTFNLTIPLKKSENKEYIKTFLKFEKGSIKLDMNFSSYLSKLSQEKNAYWKINKDFNVNYKNGKIIVLKNTFLRHVKRELKFLISLLKDNKDSRKAALLRMLYFITKPFYRKKIWLFEDKLYKAGDNGEYMYSFANKQKDGIHKYYILNKDGLDAKRFKKEKKKYVKYGSLRHKLLFLNSDIVFETHSNVANRHSFDKRYESYFRDLYNSTNICIQHGLTVQYIPHITNRIKDNLKLFFLASECEKKNLLNPEYAYQGYEEILKVTGSPRYDGLKNNDKRQILITPTWRTYLADPSLGMGHSREHNNSFKKSLYFKIYNDLINNKKLIEMAKKYNYKIIYLLHPCTSSQIEDYDKNDFVELIAATDELSYEKILTESSLMVTDYSGIQFDFAYMYKPIIYFHPDELPPSYDEGEYNYETMALGEIVKTSDKLVELLCEYMKNDCKIKKEYKKRIDKFFKYHDYNNCKRVYDEVIKFTQLKDKNK